jgi:excisionase family DNA binding protein
LLIALIPEAAQLIGVSRTTVYQLIAQKRLPVIRIGKSMRVPADALREWVRQQTRRRGVAA